MSFHLLGNCLCLNYNTIKKTLPLTFFYNKKVITLIITIRFDLDGIILAIVQAVTGHLIDSIYNFGDLTVA